MVIRTQHGLTKIKACENNAFYFWKALIFLVQQPNVVTFLQASIQLCDYFYICPVSRYVVSQAHFSLLLDNLFLLFTEKIEAVTGTSTCFFHQSSPSLHVGSHVFLSSSPRSETVLLHFQVQLLPRCTAFHFLFLIQGSTPAIVLSFSDDINFFLQDHTCQHTDVFQYFSPQKNK